WSYPTARETADYLEAYAARFELPVRTATRVDRLTKVDGRYLVECGSKRLTADCVVFATGFYGTPSVPDFAAELDPRIGQMHSSEYRDPSQLGPGGVLLVGAGNLGADIAMEVSKTHRTWLSGRDKGQVPVRIESPSARFVLPVLDGDGAPVHERGVAAEPGLYFVGLDFLYSFTSENVGGVRRDARHIAKHIASR